MAYLWFYLLRVFFDFVAGAWAEISTGLLTACARFGVTATADTDIVFFGRPDNNMALHNDITIFANDGEMARACFTGDNNLGCWCI